MKVIFNPSENKENKYIDILVNSLKNGGYEVFPLDGLLSSWKHFDSIKLVHLNWFENLDESSRGATLKSFFRKLVALLVIRLGNKKLVWTMHNRVSHEKGSGKWSQILSALLIRWADRIVIHSEESRALLGGRSHVLLRKVVHIPHPDFIGVYGPILSSAAPQVENPIKLVFIGAVKPYKNIELLIQLARKFPTTIQISILGNPNSQGYKEELLKLGSGLANLILRLEFIPDEEIPEILSKSDLVILPYNMDSSLNSGTVLLAFSYQKTVICPQIGTVNDFGKENAAIFSYVYSSEKEHMEKLSDRINLAIALKKANPLVFEEMGRKMFSLVKEQNDKAIAGQKLIDLYAQLLGEKPNSK
ncbi:glycosyltransferase [Algoriphagus litoralis]|uniref:glycosyltransferase n=1 Tax=Algoriphagus litoralis TaxID=2202829 RepID=UPI000DBA0B32|nr:glycosyltransferase [Algoriphagus litoralis]